MEYRIIPLVLSKYLGEKGIMTFLTDYGKGILRPFVMWYIEGHEKNILVDTAIEAKDYRNYHPKFKDLDVESVMTFEEALDSINLTPDRIDIVIQTHLHFDHCYNTRKCKRAKVVVQEDELKFVDNPAPFDGLYRKELLQGLNFEVIKGDRTLFDGVDLMFVPGHSAGGQAVCLQTRKGKAVISGLCGTRENFYPLTANPFAGGGEIILPGIMLDAVKAYQSMVKIKGIADLIVPLHDPEVMEVQSIP
jgi:N-acyl homoserine lactone hydrolase